MAVEIKRHGCRHAENVAVCLEQQDLFEENEMICDDVIYLISENPAAHGVFDGSTETKTMCYCRVNSVTRSEFYKAREYGSQPVFSFVLSEYADYNGEKIVEYKDKRYRVIRSYVGVSGANRRAYSDIGTHSVELTVGEVNADA